jgi:hypothetical protein
VTEDEFREALYGLVTKELVAIGRDQNRGATATEAAAKSLAMVVAMTARGNGELMNTLLEGTNHYVVEQAAFFEKFVMIAQRKGGTQET